MANLVAYDHVRASSEDLPDNELDKDNHKEIMKFEEIGYPRSIDALHKYQSFCFVLSEALWTYYEIDGALASRFVFIVLRDRRPRGCGLLLNIQE